MTSTLVDTNILIDILGPARPQRVWSLAALKQCLQDGELVINPLVWAELAASPLSELELTITFGWLRMRREALSYEAAFQAGKAHMRYRRAGGSRDRTLPDFLVGAHAETRGHRLLTRDAARYRTYFPSLDILSPETHP